MRRRDFLKSTLASGSILLLPAVVSCTVQELSIAKALERIQKLKATPALQSRGSQTPFQIFMHCAQSIDCAQQGYPENKSPFFQSLIGKPAFHAFLLMDGMKHDLNAPIPGIMPPVREGDVYQALERLEKAFLDLQAAATVKPHFFFGQLSVDEMGRAQVMHFMNHLELLS